MDVEAVLITQVDPALVFGYVDDLGRYPEWSRFVTRAVPCDPHPGDPGPAWTVDLRAHIGPMARSKRLRMVRAIHEFPLRARFERREIDDRDHAPWVLESIQELVPVSDPGATTRLTMRLHYGGNLWVPMLDRLLSGEIESSRDCLQELLESNPAD